MFIRVTTEPNEVQQTGINVDSIKQIVPMDNVYYDDTTHKQYKTKTRIIFNESDGDYIDVIESFNTIMNMIQEY